MSDRATTSISSHSSAPETLNINKFLNLFGGLVIIASVFAIGFFAGKEWGGSVRGSDNSTYKIIGSRDNSSVKNLDFNLFWQVWSDLESRYVDQNINEKDMYYGAIKGMVSSLKDPVTVFLTPEETKNYLAGNEGKFEGIGAELGYKDDQLIVVTPLKGSPAIKAGLRAGDRILKVDGKDVTQESVYNVVMVIRGKAGTKVTLNVVHPNDTKATDITITRGEITVPSVEFDKMVGDIAIVNVSRFTEASSQLWVEAWDKAMTDVASHNPKGIILDLRGNPGGYFSAAIWAAGEFLPRGTKVVSERDRSGQETPFIVDREGRFLKIPLTVLVNGSSASASEILAGALQHYRRANLIGEKTYGKGTAQEVIDFSKDGSSLHITTYKWILPSGKWLNPKDPITPNKQVKLTDEDFKQGRDPQLDQAVSYLNSKIK